MYGKNISAIYVYFIYKHYIWIMSQKVCLISSKKGPTLACQP